MKGCIGQTDALHRAVPQRWSLEQEVTEEEALEP